MLFSMNESIEQAMSDDTDLHGDVWRKEIETANCNEVYIFVKISIIAHRLFNGLVHCPSSSFLSICPSIFKPTCQFQTPGFSSNHQDEVHQVGLKIEGQILRKLDDGDVWRKEIETANCNEVYILQPSR
jgi:hypothetical protein